MSSSVTRLESGGMIQIRTGVVQGIGPQGPVGATGPQGEVGPQGAQGVPGPTGGVEQVSSQFTASTQAVALTTVTSNFPTAYTNVAFGTVVRDELNAQSSTVNFTLDAGSDYAFYVEIRFYKQASVNGTGFRAVQAVYNSVVIADELIPANSLVDTVLRMPFAFRSVSGTNVLNIKVAHNDTASLNITGRLWINQTGPGAQGTQGIQGIQGPQGDVGPQGPIGPSGAIVNNTTTISDIGGTNP